MLPVLSLGLLAIAAPAADELKQVPGWNKPLPSRQFSGYLDFGPNNRKHIHYWLVESTGRDPLAKDTPTILWMNGGPGCSSLDGWYYEHGPFRGSKSDPLTLVENPASWAQLANIVYIEAPVGVGFSYSEDPSDYNVNDDTTADDNRDAMAQFFEKFPEYKDHPFFITGESYGGVYVPTLAESILRAADNGTWTGAKLDGIAVGNGCTGTDIGVCGAQADKWRALYLLEQPFTSTELKKKVQDACGEIDHIDAKCRAQLTELFQGVVDINLYDVYGDCLNSIHNAEGEAQVERKPTVLKAPLGQSVLHELGAQGPTACLNSFDATAYFTQPNIAELTNVKPIDFQWATCAQVRGWRYTSTRANLPRDTYPYLLKHIRVMIYNGDWDACVPYLDNESWTRGMGYPVASEWKAWSYEVKDQRQVGGYATHFAAENDFSFVTVKGGRHEVPETAGDKALIMLDRFMKGIKL